MYRNINKAKNKEEVALHDTSSVAHLILSKSIILFEFYIKLGSSGKYNSDVALNRDKKNAAKQIIKCVVLLYVIKIYL